ncbi:MAG: hypothetical protein ACM3XN_02430 [Chloroflexota bacterium]
MRFPVPRKLEQVNWTVSRRTKALVAAYAAYSQHTEDEVVDLFLQNLYENPDFVKWLHGLRRNKRLLAAIEGLGEVVHDEEEAARAAR